MSPCGAAAAVVGLCWTVDPSSPPPLHAAHSHCPPARRTWLALYYSNGCNTGAVATSFCSALSTLRALPSIITWLLLIALAGCTLAVAAAVGLARRERTPIRVGGFSAKAAAQFDFRLAAAITTAVTTAALLVLLVAWPVGVLTAVQ